VAVLYLLVLLVVCIGTVGVRHRPVAARAIYRGALAFSAAPYLVHVLYVWRWMSSFGDPQPPIGVYPGLVAFAAAALGATLGLLAVAAWLMRRAPVAGAALPAALWLAYWYGALPLVRWRAPEVVPLDNVPLVWIFAASAFATVALALTAWLAFRRSGAGPGPDGGASGAVR
jgi:hypothetical protein